MSDIDTAAPTAPTAPQGAPTARAPRNRDERRAMARQGTAPTAPTAPQGAPTAMIPLLTQLASVSGVAVTPRAARAAARAIHAAAAAGLTPEEARKDLRKEWRLQARRFLNAVSEMYPDDDPADE